DKKSCYDNPIVLKATNRAIDKINNDGIKNINKPAHTLKASIRGNCKSLMREILDGLLCPYALTLKIGARVMITENAKVYPNETKKPEYVNGDLGTLVDYHIEEASRKT